MSNIWDCEYYTRCKNSDKCLSCGPNQRLLSLPEDKRRKQYRAKATHNVITPVDDNSGKTLEEYVRDKLNNVPTVKEYFARRQAGSGNIWFMPGDVADTVILSECKERHTVNSKGEKVMSITKTMLEKIMQEAKLMDKYPALPFRFKGDESGRTYVVNDFDVLCEMVHEIKVLRHDHQVVSQERDMWKATAQELHQELQRLKKRLGEEEEMEWD